MHETRTHNGFRWMAITWSEMAAWQGAHGVTLSPWEADTIRALDRAVMPLLNPKNNRTPQPEPPQ